MRSRGKEKVRNLENDKERYRRSEINEIKDDERQI